MLGTLSASEYFDCLGYSCTDWYARDICQGAFVDEESYHHVWDYACRKKCSPTELNGLRCITLNTPSSYIYTWFEEQRFPPLHELVLDRFYQSLSTELNVDPTAVCLRDAFGRTALDWATALARHSDMITLIQHGSPLDIMDLSGRTAVLHAVDSHDIDALRIVLEAGANPNPRVPEGLFRSNPLTAASFGGLIGMIELLLKRGAEADACNLEGRTALHTVASRQTVECAEILLNYGADIHLVSKSGYSPFTTAIVYNNHSVLEYFINQCDSTHLERFRLLPLIAGYADVKTMSILVASDLLKPTLDEDGFVAARETLRLRKDYDEAFCSTFEGFITN